MRGHERIIEARNNGYRPSCSVWVDVGADTWMHDLHQGIVSGRRRWWQSATEAHVSIDPRESARTADWSWCIGLTVFVTGDDQVRVEAAAERIRAAGAVLVGLSCPGYAAGLWKRCGDIWTCVMPLERKEP